MGGPTRRKALGKPPMRSRFSILRCTLAAIGLGWIGGLSGCDSRPMPAPPAEGVAQTPLLAAAEVPADPVKPRELVEPVRYDRDIRPILSDRCFICHGPDPGKRKADLRLDLAEGATEMRDGVAPIVPGDPDRSELLRRVACGDPDEVMPPPGSNKRAINAQELDLLRRWIVEGAKYEPHWAFVAPVRPEVPTVVDGQWPRNGIDNFVLANLERRGLQPSPEAAPEVLLRRAFLDLTGLSPTPAELDAFLADGGADNFERWIQKLLREEPYASRYAERMATPWLDAARYADTSGIHMDAGRSIWPWRDWILAAYRENLPFDRFVTEQIAGDLLPDATAAQRVASGFNRNHVTTDEGGAIAEEYLVEYAVDRAATTGSVFLGLTMGCARCHDHKFDPVSQEEFYRFYAYFDSIEEPGLYSQLPDAKRAFEPFMEVPSEDDLKAQTALDQALAHARAQLDQPEPMEAQQLEEFSAELSLTTGMKWAKAAIHAAESSSGAELAVLSDGSVLASGKNPNTDEHTLALRTDQRDLRMISLEALTDASFANGRVGRANNGNAVLSSISAEAISLADPTLRETLRLTWAWADHEQQNGDFRVMNTIDADPTSGWAVGGHLREGERVALFLAEKPFGFEGGTEVLVTLAYNSVYPSHVLGRVRVDVGAIADAGLALLPTAATTWALVGPFPSSPSESFDTEFGPEAPGAVRLDRTFGAKELRWKLRSDFRDGELHNDLPADQNASYVGRRVFAPTARSCGVSLGSDDGFRLYVDGVEVAKQKVDRGLALDQNAAKFDIGAGEHEIALKIVNTGGIGGFMWRDQARAGELAGDMLLALAPGGPAVQADGNSERANRIGRAWRLAFSPAFRAKQDEVDRLTKELAAVRANIPRTMVMKERAMQRETYVLLRGQYDQPDKQRKVERGVPAALGALPEGAPADRRGLAQWLVAPENPLVARVAVNRMWELIFGVGLVSTSEDFGLQGEWPSHPELLDWLALEFQDSRWDVQHMLRLMLQSATYRQSSTRRTEISERDPNNRWLAHFPRQRLSAEGIRDGALYASGLLAEKLGGASVKPYQPEGLWQEVAMPSSNTRVYERGMEADLWRRSLYTYWKRASPPPGLLTFDAPTREFCTIRRATTNTPLQALVLWNDEQYVEAARALAQRTLSAAARDDSERLSTLVRRCTGRAPDARQLQRLAESLAAFRARFASAVDDAKSLITVGASEPDASLDPVELAAWTMISSAILNLDATITKS